MCKHIGYKTCSPQRNILKICLTEKTKIPISFFSFSRAIYPAANEENNKI